MRKTQEKIIKRAQAHNLSDFEIKILSRENLRIYELNVALQYFICQQKITDRELLANEAGFWIDYFEQQEWRIPRIADYEDLLHMFLPGRYDITDTLCGSEKKLRIFKMYQYLLRKSQENGEICVNMSLVALYAHMLRNDFPLWHRKTIMRSMINTEVMLRPYLRQMFRDYPCLQDDFLHNNKKSLLYFLITETNLAKDFEPKSEALNKLYDFENHCFCFEKEEFYNYFRQRNHYGVIKYEVNETYIAQKTLEQSPITKQVIDFCQRTKKLMPENPYKGVFTTWRTWQLIDPKKQKQIQECYKILGQDFTTAASSFYFGVNISENCFVNVSYSEYKSIYVGAINDNGWRTEGKANKWAFMITPDGRLFKKSEKSKKHIPLSIKDFLALLNKKNICGDFMKFLLHLYEENNIFFRDIFSDCFNTGCIIPLNFNEVAECHNKSELIRKKYKIAANLSINWNKQDINLSYLIIKAYFLTEPGISRDILMQQKDTSLVTETQEIMSANWREKKDCPYIFLGTILYKRIVDFETKKLTDQKIEKIKEKYRKELEEELHTEILSDEYEQWISERVENEISAKSIKATVNDYVKMCKQAKAKVRLDIHSLKRL